MTKSELIQKLAEQNPHLYQRDAEQIVSTIFEKITEALEDGDRVELRGFGAFSVKHREARVGRNPRTGESVHVAAKRVPFFKTGKKLHERLNEAFQEEKEEDSAPETTGFGGGQYTPSPTSGDDDTTGGGQGGGFSSF